MAIDLSNCRPKSLGHTIWFPSDKSEILCKGHWPWTWYAHRLQKFLGQQTTWVFQLWATSTNVLCLALLLSMCVFVLWIFFPLTCVHLIGWHTFVVGENLKACYQTDLPTKPCHKTFFVGKSNLCVCVWLFRGNESDVWGLHMTSQRAVGWSAVLPPPPPPRVRQLTP